MICSTRENWYLESRVDSQSVFTDLLRDHRASALCKDAPPGLTINSDRKQRGTEKNQYHIAFSLLQEEDRLQNSQTTVTKFVRTRCLDPVIPPTVSSTSSLLKVKSCLFCRALIILHLA